MAFPVVADRIGTAVRGNTSHSINLPTIVNPGDLLIAFHVTRNGSDPSPTTPAGWTQLYQKTNWAGGGPAFTIWSKEGESQDSNTTITTLIASGDRTGSALVYRINDGSWGGTLSRDVDIAAANSGAFVTPDPPPVTASWGIADNLYIAVCATVDDDVTPTSAPTNYVALTTQSSEGIINLSAALGVAEREYTSISDDPSGFTLPSSEDWIATTIVIRPAYRPGRPTKFKPSPELVVNGGFDTDTNWTKGAGWSIAGGVAVGTAATGVISQIPNGGAGLQANMWFRITYTISNYSSGQVRAELGSGLGLWRTADGTYTEILFRGSGGPTWIAFNGLDGDPITCDIDNVSVKEVNNTISSPSELITNGGFDTDTDWTKGTGWSIAAGVATHVGPSSGTLTSVGLTATVGRYYRHIFTITNITAGQVQARVGSSNGTLRSSVGTYEEIILATNAGTIGLSCTAAFDGSIDNVSVIEIVPNFFTIG